jgi:uncharacterized protein YdhG (YjbR/CyaY superfamily)
MQSQAKDVSEYLKDVPPRRLEALQQFRDLCVTTLTGYEESMLYGIQRYTKNGTVEIAFAGQKQYVSFYVLKESVLNHYRPMLEGVSLGKGCIRYTMPEKIDFAIVEKLLSDTITSEEEIC